MAKKHQEAHRISDQDSAQADGRQDLVDQMIEAILAIQKDDDVRIALNGLFGEIVTVSNRVRNLDQSGDHQATGGIKEPMQTTRRKINDVLTQTGNPDIEMRIRELTDRWWSICASLIPDLSEVNGGDELRDSLQILGVEYQEKLVNIKSGGNNLYERIKAITHMALQYEPDTAGSSRGREEVKSALMQAKRDFYANAGDKRNVLEKPLNDWCNNVKEIVGIPLKIEVQEKLGAKRATRVAAARAREASATKSVGRIQMPRRAPIAALPYVSKKRQEQRAQREERNRHEKERRTTASAAKQKAKELRDRTWKKIAKSIGVRQDT